MNEANTIQLIKMLSRIAQSLSSWNNRNNVPFQHQCVSFDTFREGYHPESVESINFEQLPGTGDAPEKEPNRGSL
jgi:hypothetical protein